MYMERRRKQDIPFEFIGKLAALVLFMVALFLIVLFVLPERTAAAGNSTGGQYQISSVLIEEGDSLWSLASEYYTEEFVSVSDYLTEITRMNGISSTDTLYAGNYILIPQYVSE